MFTIEQIIGDIVFFSLKDKKRLNGVGLDIDSGHFLVKGYDNIGVWVEHPGLYVTKTDDKTGKPLPQHKLTKKKLDANFLIPWDLIQTIMHYPDRKGYDFPSEFDKDIGFKK